MSKKKIYAVYKGDKFLYVGTAKECAEYFQVDIETVYWWKSLANRRRANKNKIRRESKRKIAIVLEEDEC